MLFLFFPGIIFLPPIFLMSKGLFLFFSSKRKEPPPSLGEGGKGGSQFTPPPYRNGNRQTRDPFLEGEPAFWRAPLPPIEEREEECWFRRRGFFFPSLGKRERDVWRACPQVFFFFWGGLVAPAKSPPLPSGCR